jgi:hypothetical protein
MLAVNNFGVLLKEFRTKVNIQVKPQKSTNVLDLCRMVIERLP